MDFGLALWGLLTLLAIVGALHLYDEAQAFHQRGLEGVRKEQRFYECDFCGYQDSDPSFFWEREGREYCSLH